MNVREVIERYLAHSQATGLHGPVAFQQRRRRLDLFVTLHGERRVADCAPYHLSDWIEADPRWKSTATRKAVADQINACFNWASRQRRIGDNPFREIKYPDSEPRCCMPDDLLEQFERLGNKQFERAIRFLRYTGCRVGELRQATWDQMDLERGLWTIQRHKTRKKTRKPKMVALVPEAVTLLREIRSINKSDYVFLNTRGKPWSRNAMGRHLIRLKRLHGLNSAATLHGIRHQVGTIAIQNGAPLKMVSLQLGHANVATTERYYCNTDGYLEQIREAAAMAQRNGTKRD